MASASINGMNHAETGNVDIHHSSGGEPAVPPMQRGEVMPSLKTFENAVVAHNRSVNPESSLSRSKTADGRVYLRCRYKDCTYSFGAIYENAKDPDSSMRVTLVSSRSIALASKACMKADADPTAPMVSSERVDEPTAQ